MADGCRHGKASSNRIPYNSRCSYGYHWFTGNGDTHTSILSVFPVTCYTASLSIHQQDILALALWQAHNNLRTYVRLRYAGHEHGTETWPIRRQPMRTDFSATEDDRETIPMPALTGA